MNNKSFMIDNYNNKSCFSSFFLGIAGVEGIPIWVFYVNRGQAIAGFGIENKRVKTLEIEMVGGDIKEIIKEKKEKMKEAAEKLEFELALILREEISILEKKYGRQNNNKRSKRA